MPLKFIQAPIEPFEASKQAGVHPAREMQCDCGHPFEIAEALSASVFYNGGSTIFDCKIAFDCRACHRRTYISLQQKSVELGDLGASPVFDPIPGEHYAYPKGFSFSFAHENGTLYVALNNQTYAVKEYGKH